ncbi:MAG: DUF1476 domain-containing protein [Rhodospirillales bacterium]|nr:DUF1476 domain-containing protein [Rhodospirillales bacterium]
MGGAGKGGFSGNSFKKREKGEERRFEMEQDIRFKAESRRDRMLGRWLAGKFGMTGEAAEAYAKDVVHSDLHKPGADDVVAKVMADIKAHHVNVTEKQVRKELERLYAVAHQEIVAEFKS